MGTDGFKYWGEEDSLIGNAGIDSVMIYCSDSSDSAHSGIFMMGDQDSTTVFRNFRISHASDGVTLIGLHDTLKCILDSLVLENCTSGLSMSLASPTIMNSRFVNNQTGISNDWAELRIRSSVFSLNNSGILCQSGVARVSRCISDGIFGGV